MIERLAAGAAGEQRAGNVDHVRRTATLVDDGRAALGAKAARGLGRLVLETREAVLALGDAETLAPASDISRVNSAMRAAARRRMIMPGPARRHVNLKGDLAAQALPGGGLAGGYGFGFLFGGFGFFFGKHGGCVLMFRQSPSFRGRKRTRELENSGLGPLA